MVDRFQPKSEQTVGTTHPVLTAINNHIETLTNLNQQYSVISDDQEKQVFISKNYGFIGDALIEAGSFSLTSDDIITIWSRTTSLFSRYQRHELAKMITIAYAVQEFDKSEWKSLPKYFLETNQLPEEVKNDREGILHFKNRLAEIDKSLNVIKSTNNVDILRSITDEIIENFGNGCISLRIKFQMLP